MFGGTISRDKRSFLHNRSADTTSSAGSVVPSRCCSVVRIMCCDVGCLYT